MLRYVLAWFPMIAIAVANGAFREGWLAPRMDHHSAQQVSTALLIALFAVYIGLVMRKWPIASARMAVLVGAAWLALTVAFEFLIGRWVSGQSWPEMLAEYDVFAGKLWPLVPLWVGIAPYVFRRLLRATATS